MLTIVASTNATAAPSEAIASTRRGVGASRRAGTTGLRGSAPPAASADAGHPASGRHPRGQLRVGGQGFTGGPPPSSRTRSIAPHSISPTPSTGGVMTRSAWSLAAATVSTLPTVSVRTSVSATFGISASLPVSSRRIGLETRAIPGRWVCWKRPKPPVTSTAITGPSPVRAIVPTGRLSSTPPSTSRRPSDVATGGNTPGIAKLGYTASTIGPVRWTTGSRSRRSQLTQKNRSGSSSIRRSPNTSTSSRRARVPRSSEKAGRVKSRVGLVALKLRSNVSHTSGRRQPGGDTRSHQRAEADPGDAVEAEPGGAQLLQRAQVSRPGPAPGQHQPERAAREPPRGRLDRGAMDRAPADHLHLPRLQRGQGLLGDRASEHDQLATAQRRRLREPEPVGPAGGHRDHEVAVVYARARPRLLGIVPPPHRITRSASCSARSIAASSPARSWATDP